MKVTNLENNEVQEYANFDDFESEIEKIRLMALRRWDENLILEVNEYIKCLLQNNYVEMNNTLYEFDDFELGNQSIIDELNYLYKTNYIDYKLTRLRRKKLNFDYEYDYGRINVFVDIDDNMLIFLNINLEDGLICEYIDKKCVEIENFCLENGYVIK